MFKEVYTSWQHVVDSSIVQVVSEFLFQDEVISMQGTNHNFQIKTGFGLDLTTQENQVRQFSLVFHQFFIGPCEDKLNIAEMHTKRTCYLRLSSF